MIFAANAAVGVITYTNADKALECYYSDAALADVTSVYWPKFTCIKRYQNVKFRDSLSLILYKVVDPSRQIRDDALQMLETLSVGEWAEDGVEGSGSYQAAVVWNLPDSYQQFQYKLSCKLAKDHPELSQLLCEEIMQRQLDAVDIIAQQQVLTCMAPWIENLNFWKLKDTVWSKRLLKSLYYVTWQHGDQFPDEIEKLWSTIASKPKNISPVLDFLITKGIEDCDSNASAEISGAFATYFSVAKRRMLEDSVEPVRPSTSPLSPMPPEMNVVPVTSGRSGSLRSRHVSRDSGDYLFDTPNSGEEGLHSGVATHGINAKELQSALQGHQQHSLTHADIALILLAEIAYENDEDFREHLPLLFHVTFVSMDSSEDIVLEHCQHLLVNLLYSLAGRQLLLYEVENSDGENRQQVVSLIKYVQSKRGSMMWENEDPSVVRTELPSAALLSALVQSMVFLGNPVPAVLGFVMEILLTLQVMVENMQPEKVILYPQLFWGCVAMMHTDFVHVYSQVLELFSHVINHLSFQDRTTENVLLSSMPRDELDGSVCDIPEFRRMESRDSSEAPLPDGKVPAFERVQPVVLKGLMSTVSHHVSMEFFSRITLSAKIQLWVQPHPFNSNTKRSVLLQRTYHYGHSTLAFGHLLRLLEKGPVEHQRVVLILLKALLQHTPMDAAQSPHMSAIVSQLVESTLSWEALNVLEALLQNCSPLTGSHPHELASFENGLAGAGEKMLVPQMSFNVRNGHLQFAMGPAFGIGPVPAAQGATGTTESGMSAREVALRNTRLILGRVLDSLVLGRRDYRRLVLFVNTTANP
ncbi:Cell morphogenesis central region [Dillenia turbinata]|uniref:Cell morphogenesis central region n=1 Tax=Dillenia turbinata TaxID=194707 RepID=A0AAN8ULK7_9MAGN